jgi:hypothetical protein
LGLSTRPVRVATSVSKCLFGAGVGCLNPAFGQIDGVAQVEIVAPPGGNVLVEHLLNRFRDPGGRVHAVGDGVDGKLRKHLARDLAVLHGHAVGIAREAQRQQRHVQQAVAETALLFKARGAVAAEDANGLLGGEAVVAGGNRGVGGEDALAAHHIDVGFGGGAQRSAAQLPFKQRQGEQRGVAFVHVVDVDPVAEGVGHARAAHAEHDLLLQAVVGVAAVEMIGEAAIPARVAVDVGIEQVDGHDVAGAALHVVAPGAHGHDAVFHRDGDARRSSVQKASGFQG